MSKRKLRKAVRFLGGGQDLSPERYRKDAKRVSHEPGAAESTAGMGVERIARNDAIFREANDRIGEAAEDHRVEIRIPFTCECADPSCREIVRLTLAEYRQIRSDPRHFVNVAGHEASAQGWVEVVARTDGHVTVEKLGLAGEIVEELEGDAGLARRLRRGGG